MNGSHLVREARRRAGLTQAQLAGRAGTTQSAIARVESGTTNPSMEHISDLVRACGFDLEVHLVPYDDHGWTMVQRNRRLEAAERLHNMVQAANFVRVGREALESATHG
jgi:transcriptional regulator with XRE-family HTH domain